MLTFLRRSSAVLIVISSMFVPTSVSATIFTLGKPIAAKQHLSSD